MRFLPQDQETRAALLEFEGRDDKPPCIAPVICHALPFARIWDLGVGRSLVVNDEQRFRPMLVGGGEPAHRSPEIWSSPVCFMPEVVSTDRNEYGLLKMKCAKGHSVLVAKTRLRETVAAYRRGESSGSLVAELREADTTFYGVVY
jgi:hypothetical protein